MTAENHDTAEVPAVPVKGKVEPVAVSGWMGVGPGSEANLAEIPQAEKEAEHDADDPASHLDFGARMAVGFYAGVRALFLGLFALVAVALIFVFACSQLFGIKPYVIISGSMEPAIPTGSVVFTRAQEASDLRYGDVVVVDRAGQLPVTHRVVAKEKLETSYYRLILKGDANLSPDPAPYDVTDVRIVMSYVPYLGYVYTLLQSSSGIFLEIVLGIILLALLFITPRRIASRYK
ncbi:MAG: signal peptidase I [Propionibacteriaceae bacterium]|jgi:signal peptidase|nr:signal peptidase I [Propionibacteriaceae bacterium]